MSREESAKVSKRLRLYNDVASAVNGQFPKKFPNSFVCYRSHDRKRKLLVDVGEKIVTHDDYENFVESVIHFCNHSNLPKKFNVTYRTAREVAAYVHKQITCLSAVPPSLRLHNDNDYCFHRVPFEPDDKMETPIFDDFIERCSDGLSVMMFIGSIFFPDSDRQQYLWIHGEGGDGKGTFMRVLRDIMGEACVAKKIPDNAGANRFFNSTLVGRRLAIFNDCKDSKFPRSGDFKSLTGGDAIEIDIKGEAAYTGVIDTKFIFTSNELLDLSGDHSDQRRAVYTYIKNPGRPEDPAYEEAFHKEGPGILSKCMAAYQANILDNGLVSIPSSLESHSATKSSEDDFFRGVFEGLLEERAVNENLPRKSQPHIERSRLHIVLKHHAKMTDNRDRLRFFRWLEGTQAYDLIVFKNAKNTTSKGYFGLVERPKPNVFYVNNIAESPAQTWPNQHPKADLTP